MFARRLQLFRVDHSFEWHGQELPSGWLHVAFAKLIVAEVLQHAPTIPAEEVGHVLEIDSEVPVLALQDERLVRVLVAIGDVSIHEVLIYISPKPY